MHPRLVNGLVAFVKTIPAEDLPSVWRRRRGFTPAALMRFRDELLGLLEDEGMRGVILEWLDDRPRIDPDAAAALRIACERAAGWEEALAGAPAPPKPARKPDSERLARERERARAAKEEARRAREEARRAREAARRSQDLERAAGDALRTTIEDLRAAADAERRRAAELERDLKRAMSQHERELRKARKELESARVALARAKTEASQLRRDLSAAKREVARPTAARRSATKRSARAKPDAAAGPRRPLQAPAGRLEDDPETLRDWLGRPGVRLVVDGYNVTLQAFGAADLATQRRVLVQGVATLARRFGIDSLVVFDGSEVGPGRGRVERGPVRVEYSRPDEIADDHLIARLEAMGPAPIVVVTDDKELRGRAAALGATIATTEQLLALMR